ncbi:hypothetical protein WDU94_015442 [Cyamophila willieti]
MLLYDVLFEGWKHGSMFSVLTSTRSCIGFVSQVYETDVNKEYTIRGNSAILKCQIPSFVADFVSVISWHTDQVDEVFTYNTDYVVQQLYATEVNNEYVIQGNSAVLKCSIPSFVADYVMVVSWQDDQGNSFSMHDDYVVTQHYTTEVNNEHVIQGNSAVLKCVIPSFVADYVSVMSWQNEAGDTYSIQDNLMGTSSVIIPLSTDPYIFPVL